MPNRKSVNVSEPDIDRKLACLEDDITRLESEVAFLQKKHTRRKTKNHEEKEDIDSALWVCCVHYSHTVSYTRQTIMKGNSHATQDFDEDTVKQLESEVSRSV